MRTGSRSGFTLVELAAASAAAVVGVAAFMVAVQPPTGPAAPAGKGDAGAGQPATGQPAGGQAKGDPLAALAASRAKARQLKDATQIRAISQSLILFAQGNKDMYPLPSWVDANNTTVADTGGAKDTTANIFSIMIYNGSISTEICMSPAESNPSIEVMKDYEFGDPKKAVKPGEALWDPAFSADFTGGKKGNVSYAHQQPAGGRKPMWSNTFSAQEAIVGNRAPEVESVTANAEGDLTAKFKNPASNTLLIHGPKESWEGNIAYNDGHVNYETSVVPSKPGSNKDWPLYTKKDGKLVYDCLFFDEPEDGEGKNQFMGIFVKAGEKPADFKGIWD